MKVKAGDTVKVLIGKDKGKSAKIERAFPDSGKVLVTGVNLFKRHKKRSGRTMQGGIIDIAKPLPVSSVALVCPKCKLLTRVGYKVSKGQKDRVCRKCNQVLD